MIQRLREERKKKREPDGRPLTRRLLRMLADVQERRPGVWQFELELPLNMFYQLLREENQPSWLWVSRGNMAIYERPPFYLFCGHMVTVNDDLIDVLIRSASCVKRRLT